MNRKLLTALVALVLLWIVIFLNKGCNNADKTDTSCSEEIDSLERALDDMNMLYLASERRCTEIADSIAQVSAVIAQKEKNYLKIKKENETLRKNRSAVIRNYTDSDIIRYLSNRYNEKDTCK